MRDVVQDEDVDEGGEETRAGAVGGGGGDATEGRRSRRRGVRRGWAVADPRTTRHPRSAHLAGTGRGAQPSPRVGEETGPRRRVGDTRARCERRDATREDARVRREAGRRAGTRRRAHVESRRRRAKNDHAPAEAPDAYDISHLVRVTRTRRESRRERPSDVRGRPTHRARTTLWGRRDARRTELRSPRHPNASTRKKLGPDDSAPRRTSTPLRGVSRKHRGSRAWVFQSASSRSSSAACSLSSPSSLAAFAAGPPSPLSSPSPPPGLPPAASPSPRTIRSSPPRIRTLSASPGRR